MKQLLRSINLTTKLQILVEVAANQPDIQQRDVSKKFGLSPQAASVYFKELIGEGWLETDGRSKYRVTREGVEWILSGLKEWQRYSTVIQEAIADISVSAALAEDDIKQGQPVGLAMRDGVLVATSDARSQARGIAVSSAVKGEDIGVSNIEGIVPLEIGKALVLRIPGIYRGGSRRINYNKLKKAVAGRRFIGSIGIEALVALRKIGAEPTCMYGVKEAAVEAARSGISPVIVCIDSDTATILRMLEDNNIDYEILDARKS
jgi:putative transcriptional regulator